MQLNTKNTIFSAFFIAFGLIIPFMFHLFGGAGSVFLPMHIPVLLAGFFLGGRNGLLVGILTPVLSSLLTSMPPIFPILPLMVFELAVYGWAAGYFYCNRKKTVLIALALAMILGRFAAMFGAFLLVSAFGIKLSPLFYVSGAIITGLPGIIIQLLLVPLLVKHLKTVFMMKEG